MACTIGLTANVHHVHNPPMTPLATWMETAGLRDEQVAERLAGKLSRTQVCRIRLGASRPSTESAEALEGLTGIPAWKFLVAKRVTREEREQVKAQSRPEEAA